MASRKRFYVTAWRGPIYGWYILDRRYTPTAVVTPSVLASISTQCRNGEEARIMCRALNEANDKKGGERAKAK